MYSHNTLYAPCCIAPGAGLPLCSAPCLLLLLLFVLHPHHLLLLLPVHLARSAAEERHNYPAGDAHTCVRIHTLCDEKLTHTCLRRSAPLPAALRHYRGFIRVCACTCVDAWCFWMLSRCFFFIVEESGVS